MVAHAYHKPGVHIIAGIATIAQKKLRDQNDYMETVRSAIVAIAEIEHLLSQRSRSLRCYDR